MTPFFTAELTHFLTVRRDVVRHWGMHYDRTTITDGWLRWLARGGQREYERLLEQMDKQEKVKL